VLETNPSVTDRHGVSKLLVILLAVDAIGWLGCCFAGLTALLPIIGFFWVVPLSTFIVAKLMFQIPSNKDYFGFVIFLISLVPCIFLAYLDWEKVH
jgi:hypothetical protein